MGKFERKFGRYAIKNLSMILIICYAVGYLISMLFPEALVYLTLDPHAIAHGQVWRILSWILIPPSNFDLFTLIMLFFYFSIGRTLERTWGDFFFNVYIFSGMLFTVIGSFLIYGYFLLKPDSVYVLAAGGIGPLMQLVSLFFSTYYINMSIFLAFAFTFPDTMVLLMFIFPVKIKWLGYAYSGYLIYEFIKAGAFARVVIGASLLNFIIFLIISRRGRYGSPRARMQAAQRRHEFNKDVKKETRQNGISKHKCAICGRTEVTNPELQFRFCSKCNGNYEYCNDHLFNHKHVE